VREAGKSAVREIIAIAGAFVASAAFYASERRLACLVRSPAHAQNGRGRRTLCRSCSDESLIPRRSTRTSPQTLLRTSFRARAASVTIPGMAKTLEAHGVPRAALAERRRGAMFTLI